MSAATTLALAQVRRPHVQGIGADPVIPSTPGSPLARLAKRYWWTMPVAAVAVYASYRMRGKKHASAVVLDAVGVLGGLASLVALIELEASKNP